MPPGLCLLSVHAHPDDESSKGAATVARYHAEGVQTVLVCCTGGEEGDVLNPAMDRPEIRDHLPEVRRRELAEAARIIGYDEVVMLGYRDSGMAGSESNAHPDCFWAADMEAAVGRLVEVMRRTRPQVIIAYPEEQSSYPHPDHIRAHEVAVAAFEASGDADRFPGTGEPWQPLKLYYTVWSRARIQAIHDKFLELGMESPYHEWIERMNAAKPQPVTTMVDITGYGGIRDAALRAHATQVDPTSPHWFGLPPEVVEEIHPWDEYELSRNLTSAEPPEEDLFAGIRQPVRR
jgi:mycothiol S-conjugate amidase